MGEGNRTAAQAARKSHVGEARPLLQLFRPVSQDLGVAAKPDVEAGPVTVVVPPPSRGGLDRRIFAAVNGLPHSTLSDRYISTLSDLGEGLGWVAGGAALAMLGGRKGRRGLNAQRRDIGGGIVQGPFQACRRPCG